MNNDDVYRPLILCTNPNTRPSRSGIATAAAPKFAPEVRPEMTAVDRQLGDQFMANLLCQIAQLRNSELLYV